MSVNSKAKGKRGELEAAKALKEIGINARRASQYSGANGDADLVADIPGIHPEVKYCSKCGTWDLKNALLQAAEDAGKRDEVPVVLYKIVISNTTRIPNKGTREGTPWLVIHNLSDWPEISKRVMEALNESHKDIEQDG